MPRAPAPGSRGRSSEAEEEAVGAGRRLSLRGAEVFAPVAGESGSARPPSPCSNRSPSFGRGADRRRPALRARGERRPRRAEPVDLRAPGRRLAAEPGAGAPASAPMRRVSAQQAIGRRAARHLARLRLARAGRPELGAAGAALEASGRLVARAPGTPLLPSGAAAGPALRPAGGSRRWRDGTRSAGCRGRRLRRAGSGGRPVCGCVRAGCRHSRLARLAGQGAAGSPARPGPDRSPPP